MMHLFINYVLGPFRFISVLNFIIEIELYDMYKFIMIGKKTRTNVRPKHVQCDIDPSSLANHSISLLIAINNGHIWHSTLFEIVNT